MQTKTFSLIEAITSTLIGFIVSLIVQLIIYPIMDIRVTIEQNLTITTVFTIVSIVRGYLVRRFFNKIKY
jgi:hypothetical protein